MRIREIKQEAKERFAVNRYHAMLVYGVVYTLALNIAVLTTVLFLLNKWAIWYGVILIFLFLLMLAPFGFGMTGFYLKLYRFESMDAFHIFDGFNKYNLERVIVMRLLKFLLWLAFTVLLIVPGIVFSVRTSVATYLLRANPKLKPQGALKASNRVMKKHCGKYFLLVLSFTGWFFMGLLTCGLGFIWVAPYFNTAKIVFYKRELQGDTAVYKPPEPKKGAPAVPVAPPPEAVAPAPAMQTEDVRADDEQIAQAFSPDGELPEETEYAFTAEIYAEPTVPESEPQGPLPEPDELAEQRVPVAEIADTHTRAERVNREEGRSERARRADELRHVRREPLPGGRVSLQSDGRRTMGRRPSAAAESAPPTEENAKESVRERLERLRAERAAKSEQNGKAEGGN